MQPPVESMDDERVPKRGARAGNNAQERNSRSGRNSDNMENRPPPTRGRTAKQVSESDADTEADSDVEEKPRVDENTCVNGGQQAGRRHGGSPMDVAIPTPETNTTEGVDNASVGSREHTGPKSDGTAVSQAEAEGKAPRGPYRGKCLYQSRKCENERAVKRNGQAHNLCEEHRSKQNQHQRKFDAKKFSRKRRQDMIENGIRMTEEEYEMETQQELYHHQQEQQRALFLQHQQRAHALRMQEAQGSDALARGVSRDTSARPPYLPPYGSSYTREHVTIPHAAATTAATERESTHDVAHRPLPGSPGYAVGHMRQASGAFQHPQLPRAHFPPLAEPAFRRRPMSSIIPSPSDSGSPTGAHAFPPRSTAIGTRRLYDDTTYAHVHDRSSASVHAPALHDRAPAEDLDQFHRRSADGPSPAYAFHESVNRRSPRHYSPRARQYHDVTAHHPYARPSGRLLVSPGASPSVRASQFASPDREEHPPSYYLRSLQGRQQASQYATQHSPRRSSPPDVTMGVPPARSPFPRPALTQRDPTTMQRLPSLLIPPPPTASGGFPPVVLHPPRSFVSTSIASSRPAPSSSSTQRLPPIQETYFSRAAPSFPRNPPDDDQSFEI